MTPASGARLGPYEIVSALGAGGMGEVYRARDTRLERDVAIKIYDLRGITALRRLTFGGNNRFPIWSADGQRIAFQSDRDDDAAIFWQRTQPLRPRLGSKSCSTGMKS